MQFQKKSVIAVLAGVVVAGALSASAATLGGVYRAQLGGDAATVASPVTRGVDVTWGTSYSSAAKAYVVTGLTVTAHDHSEAIPPTAQVRLTVTNAGGSSLGEFTSTDGGASWTTPAGTILAEDVEGLAVVINGTTVGVA